PEPPAADGATEPPQDATEPSGPARTFLVVVDGTPEMEVALHYACRRAASTGGRVALLHVIETGEVQQWAAVEDMIRDERRQEAEQMMHKLARRVQGEAGGMAILHVREGKPRDELLKLIDGEDSLSILVLAAAGGSDGPGPLVSFLLDKGLSRLTIPVVIIPGGLSEADIDCVS
ncbi:MAG: universal stress protein, partial [Pseudomonadota bacterium]